VETRKRIGALDGLRGIAALSVVLHHSLIIAFPHLRQAYFQDTPVASPDSLAWWITYTPLHLPWLGAQAVYTFFVLSGAALALPILRRGAAPWRRYYPSRLVRLYVPAWASLAWAAALSALVFWLFSDHGIFSGRENLLTAHGLAGDALLVTGVSNVDGVLWSLQWEVLFSLLLPLYIVFAKCWPRMWYLKWLVVLLLPLVGIQHGRFRDVLLYLPMFAAGVLLAAEFERLQGWAARISGAARSGRLWGGLALLDALLLTSPWMLLAFSPSPAAVMASRDVSFLGAVLLVFLGMFNPLGRRWLNGRIAQRLAIVSFSLYLTHAVLLETISVVLPHPAAVILLGLPVALVVAHVFHRLVEAPSHRLAQVISRRDTDQRRPAAAEPVTVGVPEAG
jgi:peptidoglycan/LPS O-acetylase OafA/YrhL